MHKVLRARRQYNKLVANEMLEDFALRFTAKRARKWSAGWIANTALGIVSFLVLEALGGAITLNYGVVNSLWAIGAVALLVIVTGIPICYYAARYGVDIDLLSRGAGFGYIGSTIASLIYASFTFIFFALEAAIMSMALELLFGIPLYIGYIVSAVIVIPLVILGITHIGRFQMWSQPLWLLMQVVPLFYVFTHPDADIERWLSFAGVDGNGGGFDWLLFGAASAVLLSVVAQIGEQVDFLRFLPPQEQCGKGKWWLAMLLGGPGWMLFGAAKLVLGSFLAWLALSAGTPADLAGDPAHMYQTVFSYVTDNPKLALLTAGIFVVISQLKINVANAYAGSLAWSNFFSRLTHSHPGRVVWMVFNVMFALLLMELGVYQMLEKTLQIYSVLVLAWIGSIVADLVINKPLGLSPKIIEFKRAKLYDINPVGVGSMLIASLVGIGAHLDLCNDVIKAFASYIAFGLPFLTVPLIALLTRSRYYLAPTPATLRPISVGEHRCVVCEYSFEHEDIAFCPAYQGPICSLCCSLDVRCHDACRPQATFSAQISGALAKVLPRAWLNDQASSLGQFLLVVFIMTSVIGAILLLAYTQVPLLEQTQMNTIANGLIKAFVLLLIPLGVISWLLVLARKGSHSAISELQDHADLLLREIRAHENTSRELEKARRVAEHANQAKSRYLAGLSHELRTPLNVVLGYAQLLSNDQDLDHKKRGYAEILKRNGKHLADLLEGLLEISKIEAGRLELHRDAFSLRMMLSQIKEIFDLQASRKGLKFEFIMSQYLPEFIVADKQRLRQILINLLNNAIKYTASGTVTFKVMYRNQVARFIVEDTGIGISAADQALIFKPFERIHTPHTMDISGTGLGLTISNALAELMGGEITCQSDVDKGSTFTLRLMLSSVANPDLEPEIYDQRICGYHGRTRTILVVDDIDDQRQLIANLLTPLGFNVLQANGAQAALTLAKSESVDLFMLDIFMPNVDGWQLAGHLRHSGYKQPILMLSANIRELERHQKNHHHNDYLTKPVSMAQLLGKLSQWLDIDWQIDSQTAQSPDVSAPDSMRLPSVKTMKKLKNYAEIGFMSAFGEKLEEIKQQQSAGESFISRMEEQMQQCNFAKISQQLEEWINEYHHAE
ncbi:ATP-binding protein [Vibrio ostreae]|uniref:ATP-binding protein n=2 Tax=Vibrio TaxID=662 RepID=UPI002114BA25|nr:ATP-binding protein [Vibrio ostreae]